MAQKIFTDESLSTFVDEIRAYTDNAVSKKANSSHNHAASNITSGTLSSDRLPTVPITKGGTGATTAAAALTNLGITATASELNKLDGVTATTTELNYVDGVTSNIQTQLNTKVSTSRTINGKSLSSNITLSASDINAYTKTEIDNMEFITVEDIDTICGSGSGSVNMMTFTVSDYQGSTPIIIMCVAEQGMTWEEWLSSDYNAYGWYDDGYGCIRDDGGSYLKDPANSYYYVKPSAEIVADREYIWGAE